MIPYKRRSPGSEVNAEDMSTLGMDEDPSMLDDQPAEAPMMGLHAALGQRIQAMYVNPLLASPSLDPSSLGEATAQSVSMTGASSQVPGEPLTAKKDVNAPYRQMMEPDIKKEMIDFLALRAQARKLSTQKYQEQGLKGKKSY